ncbi:MAG TPA: hypothetical protein VIS96_12310 [Terrimicrobiaceae bacterium]
MKSVIGSSRTGLVLGIILVSTFLAEAEQVELKFVVKESEVPETLSKFSLRDDGDARNIYFLETDDMGLSRKGIILRLRENPGKRDDSTVKLRGKQAANLPDAEFPEIEKNGQESKAEKDKTIGGNEARSFSITEKQREGEVAELQKGKRELKELFSDDQERLLHKFAQGVDWQRAVLLGPVKTEKWKLKPEGFPRELTAELWHLPKCDQEQMLEFSTKVEESDAAEVERSLLELMKKKEVARSSAPESKTQAVLKCLLNQGRR